MRYRRSLALIGAGAAVSLLLAGCSTAPSADGDGDNRSGDEYTPVTIDNCGYDITFDERPSRVLIMQGASVGEVETFIELGIEDSILANTQSYGVSDIPGMAEKVAALPTGDLTLNEAMDVPAEQILALQPDLVVSTWSGGFNDTFGFATREMLHDAGINTLVNPVNCAYGKPSDITDAETAAYENASVDSSLSFIELIGDVFGVQDRAEKLVDELSQKMGETVDAVSGETPKSMLIAFPQMAAMNANGLPAVFSGGIYDSVIEASGGTPTFPGQPGLTATLSAEQLAAADVDVLILGSWQPGMDYKVEAQKIFDAYPQWEASKTGTYVGVSDGVYLGPANAYTIEMIANIAHPEAF